MALPIFIEKLEDVDESLREHYAEEDGGFLLQGEENTKGFGIGNIKKLTGALNKERTAKEGFEKRLETFSELDPEEARAAMDKVKNWDEENLDKDKELAERLEAQKKKLVELHTQEKQKLESDIVKTKNEIRRLMVDNDAHTELTTRERKGDPKLLIPHIRGRVKVIETDGAFTKQILDENGDPELDSLGNPVTDMKYLVDKLEKDFPAAFEDDGSSGTGSEGVGGGGNPPKQGTMKRSEFEKLSPDAQMEVTKRGDKIVD